MSFVHQQNLLKILKELCKSLNITLVSHENGWIFELIKSNQHYFIYGYNFFNNNSSSSRVCDDKSATYQILKSNKVDAIPHFFFMNPKNPFAIKCDINKEVNKQLKQYKNIVAKPNNSTGGCDVYLINKPNDINKAINKIFQRFDLTISPYVDIQNEYRIIMRNNVPLLVYEKLRQNNEWKHNLQHGAIPKIVKDSKILKQLKAICINVVKIININFASIDIVKVNNKYYVLEINSGVMLEKFASFSQDNYQIAKQIYRKALLSL